MANAVLAECDEVRLVHCHWVYAVEVGGGPWMIIGGDDSLEVAVSLFMETLARWREQ